MRGRRVERRPVHPGHAPAGLLDDQRAGRHVPRLQVLLPERFEASGGDVTEVERRRAQPAHRARPSEEAAEERHQIPALLCTL